MDQNYEEKVDLRLYEEAVLQVAATIDVTQELHEAYLQRPWRGRSPWPSAPPGARGA